MEQYARPRSAWLPKVLSRGEKKKTLPCAYIVTTSDNTCRDVDLSWQKALRFTMIN